MSNLCNNSSVQYLCENQVFFMCLSFINICSRKPFVRVDDGPKRKGHLGSEEVDYRDTPHPKYVVHLQLVSFSILLPSGYMQICAPRNSACLYVFLLYQGRAQDIFGRGRQGGRNTSILTGFFFTIFIQ